MKRNVYLSQVNNSYGRAAWLPFSTGMLQAYAQVDPVIREEYEFKEHFFLREPIEYVVQRMDRPAVLAVSAYIWNFNYSMALAKAVKEAHPNCLVVVGGPQAPTRVGNFFEQHPYTDILVHYEGEITFKEVLLMQLCGHFEFGEIRGISYRRPDGMVHTTPSRERAADLGMLPSPYLTGVFEGFKKYPYEFQCTLETTRGCPYSCT